MRFHRRAALVATIALTLAACGGSSEATTTTRGAAAVATTQTTVAEPTTTTAAPTTTTTTPTTTTTQATADCVVGTWEFDSEAFLDSLVESFGGEVPGEVSFAGGSYIIELTEEGTMTAVRDQWQFRFATDEGAIVNTIDGTDSGTYSIDGNTMTVMTERSEVSVTVQAEVDGELVDLPFGGAQTIDEDTFSGTGTFECNGDSMSVTFDDMTSVLDRV
jgi:hypothetical protein